ncbi:hypothetical protein C0J52_12947 [Blattella germanica]|nr:hypothetical protein C0J52_12947 [Blattella germanica]
MFVWCAGDRKYQVPNLNPLIIPEIRLSETGNGMILSNLNIHGFKDTIMDSIHYDFTAMKMALQFTVPNMMILAQYNVSEKLMYLPIASHGDINITLANCKIKFESDYLLEDKEGHQHLVVKSPTTKVEPTRAYIHLSNLFNGDTFLEQLHVPGNEMNRFIDDHWERIFKDVSPAVVEATSKVTANIINRISAVVPYNDVFPE